MLALNSMLALYLNLIKTRLFKDDSGVTAIEYGLIAALVAVVCIAAWTAIGTGLKTTFTGIGNDL